MCRVYYSNNQPTGTPTSFQGGHGRVKPKVTLLDPLPNYKDEIMAEKCRKSRKMPKILSAENFGPPKYFVG